MPTMRLKAALALGIVITPAIAASEPSRPRGVGPQFAKFYPTGDTFACISDTSITIPSSAVNDDFCDCPDGSDEPGTAACAYLYTEGGAGAGTVNTTPSLPGFYCKNKGHNPEYIPFSFVNDGICDYDVCCDGSDEFTGAGGIKCDDKCKEIGKEWRKLNDERQKSLTAANKKKKELLSEAARLKKEVEDRIKTLEAQLQVNEIKVDFLEKEVEEVKKREKGKMLRANSAAKKVGKLSILVGLTKQRIEDLVSAIDKLRRERDTARDRIEELEDILSAFKEEYNPNFNDEGVKRAVRAWEDYSARDKSADFDDGFDSDLDGLARPEGESVIDWKQFEGPEAEPADTDVLFQLTAYLPPSLRDWIDDRLSAFRIMLVENGILADHSSPNGDEEPKAVTEARSRLSDAQNDVANTRSEIENSKKDLTEDYGKKGIFRALKGQCITKDSGEYTYELCFMSRTTQISKKGSGNTGMGDFKRLETMTVDEEVPSDGKGVGSGERVVMIFEDGQYCWNGPNRSTKVVLTCAENNEIWKVVEEEKCVYRMDIGTPAVCESAKPKDPEAGAKDEL